MSAKPDDGYWEDRGAREAADALAARVAALEAECIGLREVDASASRWLAALSACAEALEAAVRLLADDNDPEAALAALDGTADRVGPPWTAAEDLAARVAALEGKASARTIAANADAIRRLAAAMVRMLDYEPDMARAMCDEAVSLLAPPWTADEIAAGRKWAADVGAALDDAPPQGEVPGLPAGYSSDEVASWQAPHYSPDEMAPAAPEPPVACHTTVQGCSACGGDHPGMAFYDVRPGEWAGPCPTTGRVVFMGAAVPAAPEPVAPSALADVVMVDEVADTTGYMLWQQAKMMEAAGEAERAAAIMAQRKALYAWAADVARREVERQEHYVARLDDIVTLRRVLGALRERDRRVAALLTRAAGFIAHGGERRGGLLADIEAAAAELAGEVQS